MTKAIDLHKKRRTLPYNLKGTISLNEAKFIEAMIMLQKPKIVLEIGVASGFSSVVILNSLNNVHKDGDFKLIGLDITENCYFDNKLKTGFIIDDLVPELRKNYELITDSSENMKNFGVSKEHFDMCFVDANHRHPYPTMDVQNTLPYMKKESIYIFHDIGLSSNRPNFRKSNGPKIIFQAMTGNKLIGLPNKKNLKPNIGAILIDSKAKNLEICAEKMALVEERKNTQ